MDEHMGEIGILHESSTGKNNIAETVPVNRISIGKVNLSGLLNSNSPRIKEWETGLNTRLNVRAYPTITLLDQYIQPNREGKFMPYQEKAIAEGRPEDAWSETLMTAIPYALRNATQYSEGISSGQTATARQIGITSDIVEDKLIIEVKDNGPGIPRKIADKLSPGRILPEEEGTAGHELPDIKVGNRLRSIYYAVEQIGGSVELVTKRIKDLKPGEARNTVRFIFPLNIR